MRSPRKTSVSSGPVEPLNTNSRARLMYAGELEDQIKDNHLAMRTLVGPFR